MRRRVVVMAGVAALALGSVAVPASADAPGAQGWWSRSQSSALPVSLPAPPNAPADGLYVASDSTGTSAFSALRFTVPDGASTGSLTLKVAANGIGTATVGLCRTTGSWAPVQNGALDKAPPYDDKACTTGAVAADGTTVTFPTAPLVNGGLLDVAIVPVKDANGNQPTFQLPLDKPDDSALVIASSASSPSASPSSSPSASPSSSSSPSSFDTSPASTPASGSAPSLSSPGSSPASTSSGSLSSSPPPGLSAPDASSFTPAAPATVEGSAALSSSPPQGSSLARSSSAGRLLTRPVVVGNDTNTYRTIGIIGLVLLAVVYTGMGERPARVPRALVAFGQAPSDELDDAGLEGVEA